MITMQKEQRITINTVTDANLCNGCGTCYSICPQSAIRIEKNQTRGIYFAKIQQDECINCGLCVQVCHSLNIISSIKKPTLNLIGPYKHVYAGYTKDKILRYRASSGGIVSAILKYAKENHLVDGFILIKPSPFSPLENVPFVSQKIEDIFRYSGTRYFPIPVNTILKHIEQIEGKYIIIGTPCQLSALRKYEALHESVKRKIFLRIGLFCGGVPNINAYSYYMQHHNIDETKVKSIYRAIGWPGNNVFEMENGAITKITKRPKKFAQKIHHLVAFFPLFSQKRCLLCIDRFGEASDLSVGDAWLNEYSEDKLGVSLIISRNELSDEILHQMNKSGLILEEKTETQLIKSQRIFSDYFSHYPTTCRFLLGRRNCQDPVYRGKQRVDFLWAIKINLINIGMKMSFRRKLWPILFWFGLLFHFVFFLFQMMEKEKHY